MKDEVDKAYKEFKKTNVSDTLVEKTFEAGFQAGVDYVTEDLKKQRAAIDKALAKS